jgi:preprotein translocase subunit SecF
MKATRVTSMLSIVLVLSSLGLMMTKGLNLGTDFKGGTKLVASFKSDATIVDRDSIREAIEEISEEQKGTRDVQVEVQDYDTTTGSIGAITRYQVVTELTSIMNDERRSKLKSGIQTLFGDNLTEDGLTIVKEGEDKFYVDLINPMAVIPTVASLEKVFTENDAPSVTIRSTKEQDLDNEFYRELNLQIKERKNDIGLELFIEKARKEHTENKLRRLADSTDDRYEVRVDQLKLFIEKKFSEKFQGQFLELESYTAISASVGRALFNKGLLAILYAIMGILVYIWLRFDIRYSPGAVVALLHDVMITLGIFALFQIKFTLPIIAALLTIIGYSLNDTIVVYDRIRENTKKVRQRNMGATVNRSINETLSRTLLTSITTLFVVVSLFALGGGQISDFALALTIGIVVGTYSSVYVASPMVVVLDKIVEKQKVQPKG